MVFLSTVTAFLSTITTVRPIYLQIKSSFSKLGLIIYINAARIAFDHIESLICFTGTFRKEFQIGLLKASRGEEAKNPRTSHQTSLVKPIVLGKLLSS